MIICLQERYLLTAEQWMIMPIWDWQFTNIFYSVAHDPVKVARMMQAANDNAVHVDGLDEVTEESAL